jgi:hypothetical protein
MNSHLPAPLHCLYFRLIGTVSADCTMWTNSNSNTTSNSMRAYNHSNSKSRSSTNTPGFQSSFGTASASLHSDVGQQSGRSAFKSAFSLQLNRNPSTGSDRMLLLQQQPSLVSTSSSPAELTSAVHRSDTVTATALMAFQHERLRQEAQENNQGARHKANGYSGNCHYRSRV